MHDLKKIAIAVGGTYVEAAGLSQAGKTKLEIYHKGFILYELKLAVDSAVMQANLPFEIAYKDGGLLKKTSQNERAAKREATKLVNDKNAACQLTLVSEDGEFIIGVISVTRTKIEIDLGSKYRKVVKLYTKIADDDSDDDLGDIASSELGFMQEDLINGLKKLYKAKKAKKLKKTKKK